MFFLNYQIDLYKPDYVNYQNLQQYIYKKNSFKYNNIYIIYKYL